VHTLKFYPFPNPYFTIRIGYKNYLTCICCFNVGGDDDEISGIRGLPKLEHLLQFTCGSPYVPTNGKKLNVQFTMGDLPDPDACFGIIKLPLNHPTLNEFIKSMNIAINCQHKGFGRG
jgi:hypothetical protein